MQMTNWKHWAVGGVAALTLMAGGLWAVDGVSAAEPEPAVTDAIVAQGVQPAGFGRGGRMDKGFGANDELGRFGDRMQEGQALLAEALGVTVEELDAAQAEAQSLAHDAALAQAVADGDLTQEQADAMKELEGLWGDRGMGRYGMDGNRAFGVAPRMGPAENDSYLAQALGITVAELEAAKQQALEAGVAQAVADESITQEQADTLFADMALRGFVADELDGALTAAIDKAVAAGVVTQEQADALQDGWQGNGRGMMGDIPGAMRGDMGRGGRGNSGRGMRGGQWNDFDQSPRGQFPGGRWNDSDDSGDSGDPDTQSNDSFNVAPDTTL